MTLFRTRTDNGEQRNAGLLERPGVSLNDVLASYGTRDSGEPVSVDIALSLPIVFRCMGILSTVVASCPLVVTTGSGKQVTVPSLDPANPATTYTPFELWELVVVHLGGWGNAFVYKVRDQDGQIIDLQPITPGRVRNVKLDQDGNKIFEVARLGKDGRTQLALSPLIYTTYEVMHIPGFGYDGLTGMSPILAARSTIGTAKAGDKLAGRFFKNGSQLSGILNVKAPLTDKKQAEAIRKRWQERHGGVDNAAEIAVLDAETSFEPLTIEPEAMQFLESRRWSVNEIARLYGIPPHLVGDVERSTSWGSGLESQNVAFVTYTVANYTNRIQQRLTREIVTTRGQSAAFSMGHLLRGTTVERYSAYAAGIGAGWLTRNEARGYEDLEPVDGLDEPVMNSNLQINLNPNNGEPNIG